jgi:hypothetical protein
MRTSMPFSGSAINARNHIAAVSEESPIVAVGDFPMSLDEINGMSENNPLGIFVSVCCEGRDVFDVKIGDQKTFLALIWSVPENGKNIKNKTVSANGVIGQKADV